MPAQCPHNISRMICLFLLCGHSADIVRTNISRDICPHYILRLINSCFGSDLLLIPAQPPTSRQFLRWLRQKRPEQAGFGSGSDGPRNKGICRSPLSLKNHTLKINKKYVLFPESFQMDISSDI